RVAFAVAAFPYGRADAHRGHGAGQVDAAAAQPIERPWKGRPRIVSPQHFSPQPPVGDDALSASGRVPGRRWDVITAVGCAVLFAAAAVVGVLIERAGQKLYVDWEPLYSEWMPHVGPGTVP